MEKEIKIGEGIDVIKFGMTRSLVEDYIGSADEIEVEKNGGGSQADKENWHFDEEGISLSFDGDCDFFLTTIAITGKGYTLGGQDYMGLNKEKIIQLMTKAFLCDISSESMGEQQEILSCEALNIDFYMDKDACVEIQWGPLFDDEDNIVWNH